MTMVAPNTAQAQIAHDHAEAVVEGHRDSDSIGLVVVTHHADELGVVQDRSVAQRGAFGEACRTRRVLDVDVIVLAQRRHTGAEDPGPKQTRRPLVDRPSHRYRSTPHMFQVWAVWTDLLDHVLIGRRQVLAAGHQDLAAGLVHRIFEFARAIGRVDVDLDGPDLGRGELHVDPLGVVRAPHADTVALSNADTPSALSRLRRRRH